MIFFDLLDFGSKIKEKLESFEFIYSRPSIFLRISSDGWHPK